ncbi:MAG: tRNA (adenosine(37)-N6)-dimethylallyltransferase MiaA [Planctomycetota bacterium]
MADSEMILILGVTASGKSQAAFEIAKACDGQILSVDSMKVYRRMDIGTSKPPEEWREKVEYHLIDIVEPSESFSVARFVELANEAIERIKSQGKRVIAVGGTAMYVKALLYGLFKGPGTDAAIREKLEQRIEQEGSASLHGELMAIDPEAAGRIHPNDRKRIIRAMEIYELTGGGISSLQGQFNASKPLGNWRIIGLRRDKADASRRINWRVKRMIDMGLVDEVRSLLGESKALSQQAACAIGYAEIIRHVAGQISLDDAAEQIKKNTRRMAKGQRTWFKTFKGVEWIDIGAEESSEEIVERVMNVVQGK